MILFLIWRLAGRLKRRINDLNYKKRQLAAVAFPGMDGNFKTVELTEIKCREGEKFELVLSLYKPGRYDIVDPDLGPTDPKFVNLACGSGGVGLFRELYEGGDDVYYWDRNQLGSCLIEKIIIR